MRIWNLERLSVEIPIFVIFIVILSIKKVLTRVLELIALHLASIIAKGENSQTVVELIL